MIAALMVAALVTACWPPPVTATPDDPYRAPACAYCPGHRGLGYRVVPGTPVTAAAAGVVEFAGQVAGTRWVVVTHDDGLRASYGHLATVLLVVGQRVAPAQPVGLSSDRVHFGLRAGDRYVDPTPLLGRWASRPRLVPVDGSPPRPGGGTRLVCPLREPAGFAPWPARQRRE